MADFFSPIPLPLFLSRINRGRKSEEESWIVSLYILFYLKDARCINLSLSALFFLISSRIEIDTGIWKKNRLRYRFLDASFFFLLRFHFVSSSVSSVSARKEGGRWRGGEGENKSPSVWLSPALSRLSNRGLRSSLLFNLSTE